MVFCCGVNRRAERLIFLVSDYKYKDRRLEFVICPVCGNIVVELTQFNVKTGEYEKIRPKRKKVVDFIKKIEAGQYYEKKIEFGTKGNAGFVYGVNEEKNGNVYQYAVDFNGQKRLVKKYPTKKDRKDYKDAD